jgi:hypothetical protein
MIKFIISFLFFFIYIYYILIVYNKCHLLYNLTGLIILIMLMLYIDIKHEKR